MSCPDCAAYLDGYVDGIVAAAADWRAFIEEQASLEDFRRHLIDTGRNLSRAARRELDEQRARELREDFEDDDL